MSTAPTAVAAETCEQCGAALPPGATRCPACGRRAGAGSPRLILSIVVLCIMAGFTLTHYFVNLHHQVEVDLAKRWFTRGEEAMTLKAYPTAADDFRTALSYDLENTDYRLRLAEALLAERHFNEARSHLLSLWDDEPADGEVNLALARLYAGLGNAAEAVRYYRNAINGVWSNDPIGQRIATRFELVQYLMSRHDMRQAAVELTALQADAPVDVPGQLRLAELLSAAGQPARALHIYDAILKTEPKNVQALKGKGDTAFALGDYEQAEDALSTALDYDANLPEERQKLELVRGILLTDPYLRGLSHFEQAKRVALAFRTALDRLDSCAAKVGVKLTATAPSPQSSAGGAGGAAATQNTAAASTAESLQQLYSEGMERKASAREESLRRNPDALDPVMQYVGDVERSTQAVCPQMSLSDRELLTLTQPGSGGSQ